MHLRTPPFLDFRNLSALADIPHHYADLSDQSVDNRHYHFADDPHHTAVPEDGSKCLKNESGRIKNDTADFEKFPVFGMKRTSKGSFLRLQAQGSNSIMIHII